jgi:3-hydroxyacyl-CoA dehydrogenase/enoyl-CoA hydratase/3-hydroxybutyryl-CoA epimerase
MPLLLEGAMLTAEQARQAGLLHAVAADDAELAALAAGAQQASVTIQPWHARNYRLPGGSLDTPAVRALLHSAPARLRARCPAPAAEAILCAMVEGLQVDFNNALLIESRYFCQTAIKPARRHGRFSL